MKVVLAPVGTRGDVQPLVALGRALQARGHEVLVAAPANFAAWVTRQGVPFLPCCADFRTFLTGNPTVPISSHFTGQAARMFAVLEEACQGANALVGAMLQLAGPSIAEKLGLPYFTAVYCPSWLRSNEQLPILGHRLPRWLGRLAWSVNSAVGWNLGYRTPINRERKARGLRSIRDAHRYLFHSGRTLLAVDGAVVPVPPFDPPRGADTPRLTGFWFLDDAAELDERLEAFLASGPRPVYIGFGSARLAQPAQVLHIIMTALRSTGQRAIVGGGWSDLGSEATADEVLTVGDVPFAALFPRMAAVVHQGGAGTFALAARAGVPQFIVPVFGDQYFWGRLVQRLELGPAPVALTALTVARLERALKSLNSPVHLQGARRTADVLARGVNGIETATCIIEETVAAHTQPRSRNSPRP